MISIKYVSTSARSLGNARGTGPRGLHRDSVSVPGLLASVYERCSQVQDAGGVRVGQTRSDLDCRVVATSRRVAPTECDSRLPLFGRGSTCRLRLLDSWPPPGSGVVFDSSRGSTRVSRPVAPTESDSSDKRRTWAVAQLVRLVRLVGRRCHDAARLVRLADGRVAARLVDSSDSSDFVGRRCHDAARLVRLAVGPNRTV